ncbi:hypothetical protein O181_003360 [Austropuccinia psidii MF-1]|uniref:Uncharacterized protein n=1 Tax=Austropuccinia psidii MF-1 TaxID=1389203 RepID=A0A9Q3GDU4_9BASI|nr:hypothetical protein [Austropuccinia psidii MF-1]
MSSFALSIYIDENECEVIAILNGGYFYTIQCIQNVDPNSNFPATSPPTSITLFSRPTLAWPWLLSNNPFPTINGHFSPAALTKNAVFQSVSASNNDPTSDNISISATTESNSTSELRQIFDVLDYLFCQYCRNFYDYVQNHPNNAGDYGSLSGLQASLWALVEASNELPE